jgi:hypothetical protein
VEAALRALAKLGAAATIHQYLSQTTRPVRAK